jgi:hypothetical protein
MEKNGVRIIIYVYIKGGVSSSAVIGFENYSWYYMKSLCWAGLSLKSS